MVNGKISYIISTRYGSEFLNLLLESLDRQTNKDYEIIIIADRPSWQTLKLLQDRGYTFGLNYFIVDHGHLCRNLDYGIQFTKSDFLCLTCDDVVFSKDFNVDILGIFHNFDYPLIFPCYYVGNTQGSIMHRDFGYPRYMYSNERVEKLPRVFSFDIFDKEVVPGRTYLHRFCGSPPVTIIHKRSYMRANGLTFHTSHPYGQELMLYERIKMLMDVPIVYTKNSYFHHFGNGGNSDCQRFTADRWHISKGYLRCNVCGKTVEVNNDISGSDIAEVIRITGLYLCNDCGVKNRINVNKMAVEEL